MSSESGRDEAQQTEKLAGQQGVSEAVPHSTSSSQVELLSTEAGCFGLDEPQESVARETASPELGSEPMDCELEDNSEAPTPCVAAGICSDTQAVADRDTSVFRPTPIVYSEPAVKCTTGTGQSAVHFVTPTVPPLSRPIHLHRNGRPFSPPPSSVILLGSLPETAVRASSELGAQYTPELSGSMAQAMVTLAQVDATRREADEVEETLLEIKETLAEVRDLEGGNSSGMRISS